MYAHTLGHLIEKGKPADIWGISGLMVFFHILSGFTLAHVYPSLENRMKVLRFWLARIGRIWPVHLLVLVAVLLFLPRNHSMNTIWFLQLGSNITMTQSWFTYRNVVREFNGPAWSLSTEFGLYLLFPLLIRNWERTWHWKLATAYGLAIVTVTCCNYCQYHFAFLPPNFATTMVYIHPFMRLPEFALGMTLALFWRRMQGCHKAGRATGTMLEAGALALCAAAVFTAQPLTNVIVAHFQPGPVWVIWFERILFPLVPYALLIFVFSMNWGAISSLLGASWLVYLGDLSFSIYVIHLTLIRLFASGSHDQFDYLPQWAALAAFWCCTMLTAYVVHLVWEQPCRNFFRRLLPAPAAAGNSKQARENAPAPLAVRRAFWPSPALQLTAALVLLALVWCDGHLHPHLQFIDARQTGQLASEGVAGVRDLKFGDRFMLKTFVTHWSDQGLKVDMVWQSLRFQRLEFMEAIHFVDKNGKLLGGADHPQELNHAFIRSGAIWQDSITFTKSQLSGAATFGIGIYKMGGNLMPVSGGVLDWNGGRLLITIPDSPLRTVASDASQPAASGEPVANDRDPAD